MDKKELQKKMSEIKSQIKANSKDAHFAETLTEELLTLKAKMASEPCEINVGKRVRAYTGSTFEIVETDKGVFYHEFGGYTIFADQRQASLYQTLTSMIEDSERYSEMNEEDKEYYGLTQDATIWCLSMPRFCFADEVFTFDMATRIVKYLKSKMDESFNTELQEETVEEDRQFEDATLALEQMGEAVKEAN